MSTTSYEPDSGMDDAQEYSDQIEYFIEDSKVLDDQTRLGSSVGGSASMVLQQAVKDAAERFTTQSALLHGLGRNTVLLMSNEMLRMINTDTAGADSVEGPS